MQDWQTIKEYSEVSGLSVNRIHYLIRLANKAGLSKSKEGNFTFKRIGHGYLIR